MRVENIELENIRSHTKSSIQFGRGFNCLVGGVGCGKSSVLYAIDFALFGDPIGRSYEYILREGAESGRVTLQFTHAGKSYTISRGLRKRGKGIGQDWEQLQLLEEGKLIAGVKGEAVAEQIKAVTGLDKELFREIVWVRQEQLKELLDMRPRKRQKRLDELFGLSNYEVGWTNLAAVQRDYTVEKNVYERDPDIVVMDKLQGEYDKAVQQFASIEGEIDALKKRYVEAEAALKEATAQLQSLEELRKKTEELGRKEAQLKASIENVEDNNARLADEIARKKATIEAITGKMHSLENQMKAHRERLKLAGLGPEPTLDELREHLQALEEQLRSAGSEQDLIKREMKEAQARLSSLTTENRCPLCLQKLSDEYKSNLLARLNSTKNEAGQMLAGLQKDFDELEKLRNLVSHVDTSMRTLIPEIEGLKNRLNEELQGLETTSRELEEKEKLERSLREQLAVVEVEIAKFNLAHLESARRLRDRAFQEYSELRNRLDTVKSRKADLASRMEDLKERLVNAEQKLNRKKRIESLLEIVAGIREAYRSIQPKLRGEFVMHLEHMIQQFLDDLIGESGSTLVAKIDETYSPIVQGEEGFAREVSNLSGGERTLLAFAYRLGLGQLIMTSRTGHGLHMLLLDEPTESLGREDSSIDRLAEAISRLKTIEQIVGVTHSEAFAEKAEHVIRVTKEAGASKVLAE